MNIYIHKNKLHWKLKFVAKSPHSPFIFQWKIKKACKKRISIMYVHSTLNRGSIFLAKIKMFFRIRIWKLRVMSHHFINDLEDSELCDSCNNYSHKNSLYVPEHHILPPLFPLLSCTYPITPHLGACTYIRNSTFFGVSRWFRI